MSNAENTPPRAKKAKRVSNFQGVGISPGTHQEMARVAKSFKLTNSVYATAAVSYFSERGLNPVTEREREGTVIQGRIDKRSDRLEQQIASLGNRLFGFLQTHEKNLYAQLNLQQKALFKLLAEQENSLFRYLTEQEANVLGPLLVEVIRGATDAFIARRVGEQIILRIQNTFTDERYFKLNDSQTKQRDGMAADRIKQLMDENPKPEATLTRLPDLPSAPAKLAASGGPAEKETPPTNTTSPLPIPPVEHY